MTSVGTRLKRVQLLLIFFITALTLSGLTAIPLRWELGILQQWAGPGSTLGEAIPGLGEWIGLVGNGLAETGERYPFLAYGTDWLAFAHVVIAIAFIGPLRNPVRNLWVIEFSMIACLLIIPWTMLFGALRGIPFFWRLIDMSFGVVGILPLWLVRREILRFPPEYDNS